MGTLDPRLDDFSSLHYQPSSMSNMHRHEDLSNQASTSYESYPPVSVYSSAAPAYFGTQNVPYETQKGNVGRPVQRQTSSGSPSPSIPQAFDHPPSTLSSASEASGQSTASSADGSPYASATHILPYEDKWPDPLHGLGIPEIVSNEHLSQDSCSSANFDNALMLEDSKLIDYVGECGSVFPPSFPLSWPLAVSVSSGLASQNDVPAFPFRPLALDTTSSSKNVTIDTILEEAKRKIQKPVQLNSPVSVLSAAASPRSSTSKHWTTSPTLGKSPFRSPLTPASSASGFPSRTTSPHSSGSAVCLGHPLDDGRALSSPQQSSELCQPPNNPHQSRHGQSPSSFLGQSSGRFVAPLQSSCRFPYCLPSFHSKRNACKFTRSFCRSCQH